VPQKTAAAPRVCLFALVLVVSLSGGAKTASAQTAPESPEPSPSPTLEPPPSVTPPPPPLPADQTSDQNGQPGAWEKDDAGSGKDGPGDWDATGPPNRVQHPHRPPREEDCPGFGGQAPYLGPAMDTGRLQEILGQARRFGFPLEAAMLSVAGPFPVAGPSNWSNDWLAVRCEPYPHLHKGLDIFAPSGTPLVAAVDGRVTQVVSAAIAGLSIEISDSAGTQYFYAHLSGFAPGIDVGDSVTMGQLVGYVGTTGNARGTSPHLHLEVQPGGVPAPPKPYVDRWLHISEHRARSWIAALTGGANGTVGGGTTLRPPATTSAGTLAKDVGWGSFLATEARGRPLERWPSLIVVALGIALVPSLCSAPRRRRERAGAPVLSARRPTDWSRPAAAARVMVPGLPADSAVPGRLMA
jgi:murein DD-endopeptidase MepM/ murein hydrolase activator NlpD